MKNTYQLILAWQLETGTASQVSGTLDVSQDNCANWDDVTLAYKRSDYDGVIRSFSTSFEFVKDAYDKILMCANVYGGWEYDGYQTNGWQNGDYCRVELRRLQEDWTYPNDADYSCDLDFSTLKLTRGKASISAFDQSLTAKVKDMGGNTYKFSQQDTDIANFCYIGTHPYCRWYFKAQGVGGTDSNIPTWNFDGNNLDDGKFKLGRSYSEQYYNGTYIGTDSGRVPRQHWLTHFLPYDANGGNTYPAIGLYCNRNSLTIKEMNFRVVLTMKYTAASNVAMQLIGKRSNSNYALATSYGTLLETSGTLRYVSYELTWDGVWGSGLTNGVLIGDLFYVRMDDTTITDYAVVLQNADGDEYDAEWYVSYPAQGRVTGYEIPAFSVSHLLDMIGEKMLNRSQQMTSESAIQIYSTHDEIDRCVLFSTGFLNTDNGYFECSYNDIKEWLEIMFDYVPTYDESQDAIIFQQRTTQFDTNVNNATIFSADECNEVTATMKANMMYGRIVAGYDKQEYDVAEYNENEYNGSAVTWSTGAASDRELKLVSNWRADTFGIEEALSNLDAEDTDSGDIWFVYAEQITYNSYASTNLLPNGTWLIPDVQTASLPLGGVSTNAALTMINRCYSPLAILENHAWQVMPCLQTPYNKNLKLISTEAANEYITIKGKLIADSTYGYTFSATWDNYPRPMEVVFTAAESPQPSNWDYLVEVHGDGMVYTGWVLDAKFHILHAKEVQYTIVANTITQD